MDVERSAFPVLKIKESLVLPEEFPICDSWEIASKREKVFKEECMYCFKNLDDSEGIFICMNTFSCFCKDHVSDYSLTSHKTAFVNLVNIKTDVPADITDEDEEEDEMSSEPSTKLSKLDVDVPAIKETPVKRVQMVTETLESHYICHVKGTDVTRVPIDRVKSRGIRSIADSIITHETVSVQERMAGQVSEWDGTSRVITKHSKNLEQICTEKLIPTSGWICEVAGCGISENLWLNLTDGAIKCGRTQYISEGNVTVGNNHMHQHYEDTGYPLVVKLGTITSEDADVYSYDEDDSVIDLNLSLHLANFGIDRHSIAKTEKSTYEMEMDFNQKYEWNLIQEEGSTLKIAYGVGFTGLINIGSSCYINSAIQMLCVVPTFVDTFRTHAMQILKSMQPKETHGDFMAQTAKLISSMLSGEFSIPGDNIHVIKPTQFRKVVGEGHCEFSTGKQQDVEEYIRYFFELLTKNIGSYQNPVNDFRLKLEHKFTDASSGHVRYNDREEVIISVSVPQDKLAKATLLNPRRSISIEDCLDAYFGREFIPDFESPITKEKAGAYNSCMLKNMPDFLLIHIRKFEVTPQFTLKKMDIDVNMADVLDFEKYRAKEHDPSEILLPEDIEEDAMRAPSGKKEESLIEGNVNKKFLKDMLETGFSELCCRKALIATQNQITPQFTLKKMDIDVNMADVLDFEKYRAKEHDPSEVLLPEDIEEDAMRAPSGKKEESLIEGNVNKKFLKDMLETGFSELCCRKALIATQNQSMDIAIDYLMNHMDDAGFMNDPIPASKLRPINISRWNKEDIGNLLSMGFTPHQANYAMTEMKGNLMNAADFLIQSGGAVPPPDEDDEEDEVKNEDDVKQQQNIRFKDGQGKYKLVGFISHMGTSTSCGHYVVHLKKGDHWYIYNDEKVGISQKPPLSLGYVYIYERENV
uniref:Ubiquitin carboxyl-terminal hydrolase n=1 Tax=Rhabditophanes sp. KR3021 TaxID=114890 RepID=A0AC35TUH2_9BILA